MSPVPLLVAQPTTSSCGRRWQWRSSPGLFSPSSTVAAPTGNSGCSSIWNTRTLVPTLWQHARLNVSRAIALSYWSAQSIPCLSVFAGHRPARCLYTCSSTGGIQWAVSLLSLQSANDASPVAEPCFPLPPQLLGHQSDGRGPQQYCQVPEAVRWACAVLDLPAPSWPQGDSSHAKFWLVGKKFISILIIAVCKLLCISLLVFFITLFEWGEIWSIIEFFLFFPIF